MKIHFVYDVVYPYVKGGVERRIWELSTRLAARGHDIHIFGMKSWNGEDIIQKDGITIHGVCAQRELYKSRRRRIDAAISVAAHLAPKLIKEDADIIDCQNFPYFTCFPAKLSAMSWKIPLFITWHEVWGDYWNDYLGWRAVFGKNIEILVSKISPYPLAVSMRTKKNLEALGVKGPIEVIPNGIDVAGINATIPSSHESDLIFAGRLIREKNVDILLDAVRIIREEIPDIRCRIIGDGPEYTRLKNMAGKLNLSDSVLFTGFLDSDTEIFSLMKSSKVFVHPSTREGFGITALEAMACGIPVIAVDHRQNAVVDIITKDTGMLCSQSSTDMAEKIFRLLEPEKKMGPACRALAADYDWDTIVVKLESIYRTAQEYGK